jgi:hypothetical protein
LAIPFLRKALVHSAGVVQRGLAAGSGAPVWGEYGDGGSLGPEWKVIRSQVKPDGEVDFAATMKDPVQGKAKMTIIGPITPTTPDLLVTTDSWQIAPGKGHIHTMMKQENSRKGDCTPGQDADCAFALDAYHPRRLSADPAANPNSAPRRREME